MSYSRRIARQDFRKILFGLQNGVAKYSTSSNQSASEYCMEMLRKYDYENFLCTLLLPSQVRASAFAIRAFNIEVAKVQDNTSDARIGQMRMKFWEDSVDKLYNKITPEHPVTIEISRALQRHKLSKRYFKRLIAMRAKQLTSSTLPTMDAMEVYTDQSVSSVYYLLLEASGIENVHADHVASHLGKAQGIANLIRSIPYNAQRSTVVLPQDTLLKHDVAEESIIRGSREQPFRDVIFEVAVRAKQHLDKARNLRKSVPPGSHLLFLPAVAVDSYLERLRQADFDAFDISLQKRNIFHVGTIKCYVGGFLFYRFEISYSRKYLHSCSPPQPSKSNRLRIHVERQAMAKLTNI